MKLADVDRAHPPPRQLRRQRRELILGRSELLLRRGRRRAGELVSSGPDLFDRPVDRLRGGPHLVRDPHEDVLELRELRVDVILGLEPDPSTLLIRELEDPLRLLVARSAISSWRAIFSCSWRACSTIESASCRAFASSSSRSFTIHRACLISSGSSFFISSTSSSTSSRFTRTGRTAAWTSPRRRVPRAAVYGRRDPSIRVPSFVSGFRFWLSGSCFALCLVPSFVWPSMVAFRSLRP